MHSGIISTVFYFLITFVQTQSTPRAVNPTFRLKLAGKNEYIAIPPMDSNGACLNVDADAPDRLSLFVATRINNTSIRFNLDNGLCMTGGPQMHYVRQFACVPNEPRQQWSFEDGKLIPRADPTLCATADIDGRDGALNLTACSTEMAALQTWTVEWVLGEVAPRSLYVQGGLGVLANNGTITLTNVTSKATNVVIMNQRICIASNQTMCLGAQGEGDVLFTADKMVQRNWRYGGRGQLSLKEEDGKTKMCLVRRNREIKLEPCPADLTSNHRWFFTINK